MDPINLNELDPSFKTEVSQEMGGAGIQACYTCRSCTAVCPVAGVNEHYDPRKIIRKTLLGMKDDVLKDEYIWFCSSCYACHEVCPQEVKFTDVIIAIKNLACRAGHTPQGLSITKAILKNHGRLYEVTDFENEKREKLGLPRIIEQPDDFDKLLPTTEE